MEKSKKVRIKGLVATALSIIGLRNGTGSSSPYSDVQSAADELKLPADVNEYENSHTMTNPSIARGGFGQSGWSGGG
jgi:hypothetical protein